MKLIIDVSTNEYELVRDGNKSPLTELELMNAVAKGTSLPRGHGKLIDADIAFTLLNERRDAHDKMMANYEPYRNTQIPRWVWDAIVEQTTVIDADKE